MARDMLIRYIIALTNLYGIAHKKMVCDIYNQQNRDSVNIRQVEALLRNPPQDLVKNFVVCHGEYFVNDSVFEFDEFDELLQQKENQPYYIPSQDELLKYEDGYYYEITEPYRDMYNYIKYRFYSGDDEKTKLLAEDIQGLCKVESDVNTMINEFSRRGLKFKNNSQREEVIRLIEDLAYNTRLWSNNGFTDHEREQNLEDTLTRIIYNFNIQQAVASQPIHDLQTILGFHSVSDLREIAKILNMTNTSKLKKIPLTVALLVVYSRLDVIEYFLKYMHREAWDNFLAASRVDEYVVDNPLPESYMPLQKLCLVQLYYYDEKLILVVPDEVKCTFEKLKATGFVEKKQLMDDHVEFAKAAINLYGVISLDEYVNLFNRMKRSQTDKSQAYELLKDFAEADIAFFFWNDYLVSNVYSPEETDEISNMLQEQRGKPRYVPTFDEFILYSDDDYYEETPQLEKLEDFLSRYINDEDELEEIIDMIHDLCMDAAMPTEHLEILKMRGVEFEDINTVNEFLQILADVINNTRIWENNGLTPSEIINVAGRPKVLQFPTGKPVTQDKVGRNDPCPCGSGKKYKNCCGK